MIEIAERVEEWARPFYDARDSLHGLKHVQRILFWATRIWSPYLNEIDRRLVFVGAYLHGPVNGELEAVAIWLAGFGYDHETMERITQVAHESQAKNEPRTLEGMILHDAHTIEGGRLFRFLKPLLTGTYMRQEMSETMDYIRTNIMGTGKVYLPQSEPFLRDQEETARWMYEELDKELDRSVQKSDFLC